MNTSMLCPASESMFGGADTRCLAAAAAFGGCSFEAAAGLGEAVWALRPGNLEATAVVLEALADTAAAEAATALAASMNLSRCLLPVAEAYQGYLLTWKPAEKVLRFWRFFTFRSGSK